MGLTGESWDCFLMTIRKMSASTLGQLGAIFHILFLSVQTAKISILDTEWHASTSLHRCDTYLPPWHWEVLKCFWRIKARKSHNVWPTSAVMFQCFSMTTSFVYVYTSYVVDLHSIFCTLWLIGWKEKRTQAEEILKFFPKLDSLEPSSSLLSSVWLILCIWVNIYSGFM